VPNLPLMRPPARALHPARRPCPCSFVS
jgi:hypothetical protein